MESLVAYEDDYLPEESSLGERLLGPAALSLSLVALIGAIMALMLQFQEEPLKRVVVTESMTPPPVIEELPPPPPPSPILKEQNELKKIVEKPVVLNREETPEDVNFQEDKGDPNLNSDVDFDLPDRIKTLGAGVGGAGKYGTGRGGRVNGARIHGATHASEAAVSDALRWLKRHQDSKGNWDLASYQSQCGHDNHKGKCDGFGLPTYNIGGTGLALLAYSGRDLHHQKDGVFKETIARALKFLLGTQKSDGAFGAEEGNFMYNQSLATFALADLLNTSGDEKLKAPVQKGIDWLLEAQNDPTQGGAWRYANYKARPDLIGQHLGEGGAINDTSVTTWVIMALKTAKEAGLTVADKGYEGATVWLDSVYDGQGYSGPGTFGYSKKLGFVRGRRFGTTSCGMLSRQFMKQTAGVATGAETLLAELPDWQGVRDMYYWYYGSMAMFQLGGDYWQRWHKAMQPALTKSRHKKAGLCLAGSWDPQGTCWGEEFGGRIYTTAIGALTLEVYYRYQRMLNKE